MVTVPIMFGHKIVKKLHKNNTFTKQHSIGNLYGEKFERTINKRDSIVRNLQK